MYIKVINPQIHGNTTFSNTGSCKNLVDYLSKENEKLPLEEKELFFNHEENELSSNAVINMIDNNVKGIAKGRTKFHSLVIAPDKDELSHIQNNPIAIKKYTIEVMKQYAQSFNLKSGKRIALDDIVWAAKLEKERNGEFKNGENMHVHIIVSARDKEQSISLSPNINDKSRFNRVQFYLNAEQNFDKLFNYKRVESLLQTDQVRKHGTLQEKEEYFSALATRKEQGQNINQSTSVISSLSDSMRNLNTENSQSYKEEKRFLKYRKKRKRNKKQGPTL